MLHSLPRFFVVDLNICKDKQRSYKSITKIKIKCLKKYDFK